MLSCDIDFHSEREEHIQGKNTLLQTRSKSRPIPSNAIKFQAHSIKRHQNLPILFYHIEKKVMNLEVDT